METGRGTIEFPAQGTIVAMLDPCMAVETRCIMHEMSLAEGIVQLVEDTVRADGCSKVKAVWVEIGQLAVVEKDALRFCFDAVARDTVAEGARLEIVEMPGCGRCMSCGANVAVTELYDACPVCGNYRIQVTGGNEMRVRELEVE